MKRSQKYKVSKQIGMLWLSLYGSHFCICSSFIKQGQGITKLSGGKRYDALCWQPHGR